MIDNAFQKAHGNRRVQGHQSPDKWGLKQSARNNSPKLAGATEQLNVSS